MDISFVIPCYCSEKNIDNVINKIYRAMKQRPNKSFEIILVNDNSRDNTWKKIQELTELHKEIIGINFSYNFGQHNALMAGFRAASGELIMTSDDDGQTPVERIWDFEEKINEGYDVVCSKYVERRRKGLKRKIGTFLNEYMLQHMLGKPKDVYMAAFFMARKFVIKEMCRYEQAYPYIAGLILRSTKNIGNIEMVQENRASGSSGYNFAKLIKLWINGFTSFSIKPLRFFIKMGFAVAIIGCILGLYIIIKKIIFPTTVLLGYTSMISVMCILGGLNLSVLGMVGEYIGRIYMCSNAQPQYVIRNYARNGAEKDGL